MATTIWIRRHTNLVVAFSQIISPLPPEIRSFSSSVSFQHLTAFSEATLFFSGHLFVSSDVSTVICWTVNFQPSSVDVLGKGACDFFAVHLTASNHSSKEANFCVPEMFSTLPDMVSFGPLHILCRFAMPKYFFGRKRKNFKISSHIYCNAKNVIIHLKSFPLPPPPLYPTKLLS